jgi:hypothetical protein
MLARVAWTLALGTSWFGSKPVARIRTTLTAAYKVCFGVREPSSLFSSRQLATASGFVKANAQ